MSNVITNIERRLNFAIKRMQNRSFTKSIANMAAFLIKKRTRLGFGSNNNKKERLTKLSDSYKDTRKGKIAFARNKQGKVYSYKPKNKPNLSSFTSAGKSNLTFTGQLLDSIFGRAKSDKVAEVYIKDKRNDGLTNTEVLEYVEKERPFFELTVAEIKQIQREVRIKLQSELKKVLK